MHRVLLFPFFFYDVDKARECASDRWWAQARKTSFLSTDIAITRRNSLFPYLLSVNLTSRGEGSGGKRKLRRWSEYRESFFGVCNGGERTMPHPILLPTSSGDTSARNSSNDIVKAPVKAIVDLDRALWFDEPWHFSQSAAALLNLRCVHKSKFLIEWYYGNGSDFCGLLRTEVTMGNDRGVQNHPRSSCCVHKWSINSGELRTGKMRAVLNKRWRMHAE